MKKTLVILSVLAAVMFMFTAPACVEAADGAPKTVKYTLISETWAFEPRVTAIAIEYDKPLQIDYNLTDSFEVFAELQELTDWTGAPHALTARPRSPRRIVKAYTSNQDRPGVIREGKYVILELDVEDDNATSVFITTEKHYTMTGVGWMTLPYKEKMVYDIKQLYALKYYPYPINDENNIVGPAGAETPAETTGTNITFQNTGNYPILLADEFVQKTFNGTPITFNVGGEINGPLTVNRIRYNMYSPSAGTPAPADGFPIVFFFHGSSSRPTYVDPAKYPEYDEIDPKKVIWSTEGATTWIKRGSRAAYVVAPQYEQATVPMVKEMFWDILNDPAYNIDKSRIYIAGLSMGGDTSWRFLLDEDINSAVDAAVISAIGPAEEPALVNGALAGTGAAPQNSAVPARIMSQKVVDRITAIGADTAHPTDIWQTFADLDNPNNLGRTRKAFSALMGAAAIAETSVGLGTDKPLTYTGSDPWYGGKITLYDETMPNGASNRYSEIHSTYPGRNTDIHVYSPDVHESYEWTYWNSEIPEWLFQQVGDDFMPVQ